MTVTSLKANQTYDSFLAGNVGLTSSFESIATVTVGSGGASSIEFTSIPSTYTHLQIRGISRSNRAGNVNDGVLVRFNSDSGAIYRTHGIAGVYLNTATGYTESPTNAIVAYLAGATNTLSSVFGGTILEILDYANTNKFKTIRCLGGIEDNTYGYIGLQTGHWRSTSAITTITLTQQIGSSWNQYTTFALYGIKGAA